MKKNVEFYDKYLYRLQTWFGYEVNPMDDFNEICQCELDFIEILLLGEMEFEINLLETALERNDFSKIIDYLEWASIQYTGEKAEE